MRTLSKVCDGADWFDPELLAVIDGDLRELARFHRKQWEFAMILLALRRHGVLRPDALGLSMGSGRERLLYAVARQVRRVVATDLYDASTEWETASTSDPDRYIKEGKPFPVDDDRLQALRMDMRSLEFEDGAFDFCYSSCAVEHIGGRDDFLKHLAEVRRVLKGGGIYAFTTELHYGPETIEHPHNYYFSSTYLADLIAGSGFAAEAEIDARVAHHRINYPLPEHIDRLCADGTGGLARRYFSEASHVQLLLGKHPFTSVSVVLRKEGPASSGAGVRFPGLADSREFVDHGVAAYRDWIEQSRVPLDPFSSGGDRARPVMPEGSTVFHTDYEWFGSTPRTFRVRLGPGEGSAPGARVDLLVHRVATLRPDDVTCVRTESVDVSDAACITRDLTVDADDRYRYAVLARMMQGSRRFERIDVEAFPAGR